MLDIVSHKIANMWLRFPLVLRNVFTEAIIISFSYIIFFHSHYRPRPMNLWKFTFWGTVHQNLIDILFLYHRLGYSPLLFSKWEFVSFLKWKILGIKSQFIMNISQFHGYFIFWVKVQSIIEGVCIKCSATILLHMVTNVTICLYLLL